MGETASVVERCAGHVPGTVPGGAGARPRARPRDTLAAMVSTSLEMSASAQSRKESGRKDLDESIAILRDHARPFARLSASARADLLRACLPRIAAAAPRWVEAAIRAKGLPAGAPPSSEELLAGPLPVLRNARILARSLDDIAAGGKPVLPRPIGESRDGRALVPVFPGDGLDRALFAGFTCDVRMLPGVSAADVRAKQASFYGKKDPEGAVSLVLGAGNVSSIPPMDAFYKMFVDGSVCLVKMNPVNEYLGPFYEEALRAAHPRRLPAHRLRRRRRGRVPLRARGHRRHPHHRLRPHPRSHRLGSAGSGARPPQGREGAAAEEDHHQRARVRDARDLRPRAVHRGRA